jgi:hypothetical protein
MKAVDKGEIRLYHQIRRAEVGGKRLRLCELRYHIGVLELSLKKEHANGVGRWI